MIYQQFKVNYERIETMTQYIKDKKINIYKIEWTLGSLMQDIKKTVIYAENIWVYYRQASAKESFEAGQVGYKVDAVFRINWRDDLDTTMTIGFRGKEYTITRIDDFEGYKNDLVLYATSKGDNIK